jgi:hypothetical protein
VSFAERPPADALRKRAAAKLFPLALSPEEYAARSAHLWGASSFHCYRYEDPLRDAWIQRLADMLLRRDGAKALSELRAKYLNPQERAEIARLEREPL